VVAEVYIAPAIRQDGTAPGKPSLREREQKRGRAIHADYDTCSIVATVVVVELQGAEGRPAMRLPGCAAIWLFAAVLLSPLLARAMERIEVPIKQTVLSDGEIRYSVLVIIGASNAIDAMLDTGSSGLRILADTIPASAYSISDQASVYGYGSGVRLNGVIANAVVTIGGASSQAPIPFQLVRSVDCFPNKPHCPASRISPEDYRIGGNGLPRQGFRAIIGINTGAGAGADAVNPIGLLGTHSWIVVLPRPGDKNPGTLVINPGPNDRSGYVNLPTDAILRSLPAAGGFHDAVSACLAFEATHKRICGPTLLDTGAPGFHINSSHNGDLGGWSRGDRVALVFRDSRGAEVAARFTAGADRPARFTTQLSPNQPRTRISAGSLPYFDLSVLYDDEQHVIGLKPR
jgi:hypothetical protein